MFLIDIIKEKMMFNTTNAIEETLEESKMLKYILRSYFKEIRLINEYHKWLDEEMDEYMYLSEDANSKYGYTYLSPSLTLKQYYPNVYTDKYEQFSKKYVYVVVFGLMYKEQDVKKAKKIVETLKQLLKKKEIEQQERRLSQVNKDVETLFGKEEDTKKNELDNNYNREKRTQEDICYCFKEIEDFIRKNVEEQKKKDDVKKNDKVKNFKKLKDVLDSLKVINKP